MLLAGAAFGSTAGEAIDARSSRCRLPLRRCNRSYRSLELAEVDAQIAKALAHDVEPPGLPGEIDERCGPVAKPLDELSRELRLSRAVQRIPRAQGKPVAIQ